MMTLEEQILKTFIVFFVTFCTQSKTTKYNKFQCQLVTVIDFVEVEVLKIKFGIRKTSIEYGKDKQK